mmetsp:Transcript_21150/g.82100  ORF Transcript_21150/g.82100 Transcript_21150/m.82100 type:complete len:277 (+) Transcript_21150:996-1826(+)
MLEAGGLVLVLVLLHRHDVDVLLAQEEDPPLPARAAVVLGDVVREMNLVAASLALHHLLEGKVLAVVDVVARELPLQTQPAALLLARNCVVAGHLELPEVPTEGEAQEEALDAVRVGRHLALAQLLQLEDRLRVAHEELRLALGDLLRVQVHRPQDGQRAVLVAARPRGPRLVAADAVAEEELVVELAVGEACAAHAHVLQQSQVADLVERQLAVEAVARLLLVGLDAAAVVRLALGQRVHQEADRRLDLEAGSGGPLLGLHLTGLGEEVHDELTA